jgi:tetratricopeptide (TPR) repeat protein
LGTDWTSGSLRALVQQRWESKVASGATRGDEVTSDPARRLAVDDPALVTALTEFLNSPDWGLVPRICAQHPVLLDDRADQALADLAAQARFLEVRGLAESITLHRRVLARVREVGAQQAAAEMAEADRQSQEYLLRLLYKLGAATLESVSRLRDLITNRPEVLSLEFDALVGRFLASYRPPEQTDNPGAGQSKIMVDAIRGGRRILRWCREGDMDTAFTRLESALARSTELTTLVDKAENDIRSYLSDNDPMALRGAAETSVAILDHPALLLMMPTTAIQVLVKVGAILQERCRVELDLHLLELRIHAAQRGLEEAAEGSAERFVFFGQLGSALSERGMYTGSSDDIRHAAGLYRKAMSETPEDAPEWADRVNALGAAHHDLYRLASAPTDLDAAIELFGQAATGKPSVLHRGNLAMALRDRFTRDGDPADLERAIAILNEIVSTTLDTELRLPRFLADLATAQLERFTRAADSEGLDDAIRCCERALTLGPSISDRVNAYLFSVKP